MHHEVRAEGQRLRQDRAGGGAVHGKDRAHLMRRPRGGSDVGDPQPRVRWRLDPDQRGAMGAAGLFQQRGVGGVDLMQRNVAAVAEIPDPLGRTPIDLRLYQYRGAIRHRPESSRHRRHAGGEKQRIFRPFQPVQYTFGNTDVFIVTAQIGVIRVAQPVLVVAGKGRGGMNTRNHARRGIVSGARRMGGDGRRVQSAFKIIRHMKGFPYLFGKAVHPGAALGKPQPPPAG